LNKFNREAQEKLIKEAENLSALLRTLNQGIFQIRERSLVILSILLFGTILILFFSTSFLKVDVFKNNSIAVIFTLVLLCLVIFIKLKK
jgi:uncharacterized membrane protein